MNAHFYLPHLFPLAVLVTSLTLGSSPASAGPLMLLLNNDDRSFGLDEWSQANIDIESFSLHPAKLGSFSTQLQQSRRFLFESRYMQERTYRRSRGEELTRVGSAGSQFGLFAEVPNSSWRLAASWKPSESEEYKRRVPNSDTQYDGGYDEFRLAVGRPINQRLSFGVGITRSSLDSALEVQPFSAGTILGSASEIDGPFQDASYSTQLEYKAGRKWDVRLGAGYIDTDLQVNLNANPADGQPGAAVQMPISGDGFRFDALVRHRPKPNSEWILQLSGESRRGDGDVALSDGQQMGRGRGTLRRSDARLTWITRGNHHAFSLGAERWGGHGNLGLNASLAPLFPDDSTAASGDVNGKVDVHWKATLVRAGYQQQVTSRLQAKAGLGFGRISASANADAQASFLLGLITYSYSSENKLGPRLGFLPALGLRYQGKRIELGAQVAQFIPLPQKKSGGDDQPNPNPNPNPGPDRPKSSTFGGNLLTLTARIPF